MCSRAFLCRDSVRVAAAVMRGHRALGSAEIYPHAAIGVNRLSAIDVNGLVALARIEVFQASSSQKRSVLWTLGRCWECSFMCRIDGAGSRSETTLAWGSICAIWRQSYFWVTINQPRDTPRWICILLSEEVSSLLRFSGTGF
jgi:hypothetical protein